MGGAEALTLYVDRTNPPPWRDAAEEAACFRLTIVHLPGTGPCWGPWEGADLYVPSRGRRCLGVDQFASNQARAQSAEWAASVVKDAGAAQKTGDVETMKLNR